MKGKVEGGKRERESSPRLQSCGTAECERS